MQSCYSSSYLLCFNCLFIYLFFFFVYFFQMVEKKDQFIMERAILILC